MSEFEETQHFHRLIADRVGDDGDTGGLAAGIELDPDRVNLAPDTVSFKRIVKG
jgi:hypothetical protein